MHIVLPPRIDPDAVASGDPAAVVTLGGETMGTMWRVLYATRDVHGAQGVGAAVQARLDDLVAQMSHWTPDSVLAPSTAPQRAAGAHCRPISRR